MSIIAIYHTIGLLAGKRKKIYWYWRSTMLVHVKTPHTEIEIKGDVSDKILEVLQSEYGEKLEIQKDEYSDPFETARYNEIKESLTPGDYLKTDRENKGITQNELVS
ncbi:MULTISPECIES: hypothetical protein [unclassified Oceanispirochaeta]|uniref:hypothetical protein n=1 Tax=unclassified Oceanispirochaeta TaxID=2635722 RepID=UPI000E08D808|nr:MULTISPECIES: hypothetical protein [unclassified Oceanispirochaeta]MBF9018889.1 hypothetical protein [Oceanispirochaeta sp. M2]NPD75378.1 hypothetical protein [Oceanispirochaeta sp. M1]RDG28760.1 hypothetical protein DV872_25110 [Oceanispirochaeta sp. M1]